MHKTYIDSLSLVRNVLPRIILFNPGIVSEFHSRWSEKTSVPIIYFLRILRCTLTSYIPTHRQDLHSKSKSQTRNIRATWNSIDPNGYSMGSKSNIQTSWNSSHNTHRCMLWGRRKQEENLRLHGCMLKQSKFDSTYCTNAVLFISINCTKNVFRDTRRINETISIFRCQRIWLHAQMIHLCILHSAARASSSIFSSLSHSPVVLPGKGC